MTDVAKRSLYRMPYNLGITMEPTFAPKGNKVIGGQQSASGDGEVDFPYDLVALDSIYSVVQIQLGIELKPILPARASLRDI